MRSFAEPALSAAPLRMTAPFNVVLFDIDNVLVDTRASYLAAIQKTVEHYLNHHGIISLKEIDQFKLLGGFNDDWDCCYGIITFLETSLQGKPVRFGDHRHHRLSIAELAELFPERPLGMEGLLRHLGILYERVETPSFKKIARIFQEIYRGKNAPGLIEKERPIFQKSLLEKIRKKGIRMGIVTGRNRFEAQYALKRFGISKFFDAMVTIDDVRREEKKTGRLLRKPHPWPILEAARKIRSARHPERSSAQDRFREGSRFEILRPATGGGTQNDGGVLERLHFLYVGDLPDDILAAKRARPKIQIKTAAFPVCARDSKAALRELRKAGPDFLLKRPSDLLRLLK